GGRGGGAGGGEGLTEAVSGGRGRKSADEEFDCHAKGSILGRTVHSEPTTTSDAPKYTLSEAHTRRIFPRRKVLGGREPHRAAALRRAVPRPLRRRARPACARGNPDRRGRHPLACGGLPLVARAPRDPHRRARGRRGALLGRPPLGRAPAGVAPGAASAEPGARGAPCRGVPGRRRESSVERGSRDGTWRRRATTRT